MRWRAGLAAALALTGVMGGAAVPRGWNLEPGYIDAMARAHCSQRWPDDFALQAACVRNAHEGAADFGAIAGRHAGEAAMTRALATCFRRWTQGGVTDFALAGACARNQEEGLRELQR